MGQYFVSAFGVFLMRQTFRTIPRNHETVAHLPCAAATVIANRREDGEFAEPPAFLPHNLASAAPIGVASLIVPKGNSRNVRQRPGR